MMNNTKGENLESVKMQPNKNKTEEEPKHLEEAYSAENCSDFKSSQDTVADLNSACTTLQIDLSEKEKSAKQQEPQDHHKQLKQTESHRVRVQEREVLLQQSFVDASCNLSDYNFHTTATELWENSDLQDTTMAQLGENTRSLESAKNDLIISSDKKSDSEENLISSLIEKEDLLLKNLKIEINLLKIQNTMLNNLLEENSIEKLQGDTTDVNYLNFNWKANLSVPESKEVSLYEKLKFQDETILTLQSQLQEKSENLVAEQTQRSELQQKYAQSSDVTRKLEELNFELEEKCAEMGIQLTDLETEKSKLEDEVNLLQKDLDSSHVFFQSTLNPLSNTTEAQDNSIQLLNLEKEMERSLMLGSTDLTFIESSQNLIEMGQDLSNKEFLKQVSKKQVEEFQNESQQTALFNLEISKPERETTIKMLTNSLSQVNDKTEILNTNFAVKELTVSPYQVQLLEATTNPKDKINECTELSNCKLLSMEESELELNTTSIEYICNELKSLKSNFNNKEIQLALCQNQLSEMSNQISEMKNNFNIKEEVFFVNSELSKTKATVSENLNAAAPLKPLAEEELPCTVTICNSTTKIENLKLLTDYCNLMKRQLIEKDADIVKYKSKYEQEQFINDNLKTSLADKETEILFLREEYLKQAEEYTHKFVSELEDYKQKLYEAVCNKKILTENIFTHLEASVASHNKWMDPEQSLSLTFNNVLHELSKNSQDLEKLQFKVSSLQEMLSNKETALQWSEAVKSNEVTKKINELQGLSNEEIDDIELSKQMNDLTMNWEMLFKVAPKQCGLFQTNKIVSTKDFELNEKCETTTNKQVDYGAQTTAAIQETFNKQSSENQKQTREVDEPSSSLASGSQKQKAELTFPLCGNCCKHHASLPCGHKIEVHNNLSRHKGNVCYERSPTMFSLERHSHRVKPFVCNVCHKTFIFFHNLEQHTKTKH